MYICSKQDSCLNPFVDYLWCYYLDSNKAYIFLINWFFFFFQPHLSQALLFPLNSSCTELHINLDIFLSYSSYLLSSLTSTINSISKTISKVHSLFVFSTASIQANLISVLTDCNSFCFHCYLPIIHSLHNSHSKL